MLKLYYHVPGDNRNQWPDSLRNLVLEIHEAFVSGPYQTRYHDDFQSHRLQGGELTYTYWDCPSSDFMGRYHRLRLTARTPAAELWLMLNAPADYQVGGPRENARLHP